MPAPSVLIVEDDPRLRSLIVRSLADGDITADGYGTGAELVAAVRAEPPHALVLDIGLPDSDGRDICQSLRAAGYDIPVLFLTAKDTLTERLSGFDAGGDDYLTKPFAVEELIARVKVLLRRNAATTEHAGSDGADASGLWLEADRFLVHVGEHQTKLTPTEFRLLGKLLGERGTTVRRIDLKNAGWPRGAIVEDNTLDQYVARIRRKLRELPGAPTVETVPYAGYRVE